MIMLNSQTPVLIDTALLSLAVLGSSSCLLCRELNLQTTNSSYPQYDYATAFTRKPFLLSTRPNIVNAPAIDKCSQSFYPHDGLESVSALDEDVSPDIKTYPHPSQGYEQIKWSGTSMSDSEL
ncbi:hypothetical protein J6590_046831 [Homalodisca vitripennis]|nr:hypothetical protein J6590_046831 [Homalodisca vitripennis]